MHKQEIIGLLMYYANTPNQLRKNGRPVIRGDMPSQYENARRIAEKLFEEMEMYKDHGAWEYVQKMYPTYKKQVSKYKNLIVKI